MTLAFVKTQLAALALAAWVWSAPAQAEFAFPLIEGGELDLAEWRGDPVLVVNTASQCAYTGQYDGLQQLQDNYGARGLHVLAVPSDDFDQELSSEAAVKAFCDVNFNLTLAMTEITPVTGDAAHPFYAWVKAQTGFVPQWNFNKILLDGQGQVVATWGAGTSPASPAITRKIETLLR